MGRGKEGKLGCGWESDLPEAQAFLKTHLLRAG